MSLAISEDVKLPSYINIIFLNYIYIINLIKKHIIYYKRTISKVNEISGNMGKYVEESKDTIQSNDEQFMENKEQSGIDDYLEGLDDGEEYGMSDEDDVEVDVDEE